MFGKEESLDSRSVLLIIVGVLLFLVLDSLFAGSATTGIMMGSRMLAASTRLASALLLIAFLPIGSAPALALYT